ncbi:tRNA uridine-5-carboxymethylaminomethyl(34) synthesis enzyme MnmG [Butyrivibrio sp. INlla16]|uniref:tRNA uridine-5-carboxymethylaminomethyl(34) synthesis enzyme MnmG n=1 Tax=Butyrivibrio sp. INlla16 TaxID=1520807 RepID=UPI0008879A99|nr:tRNA uridine-5-carboxymethylaminomethyl(34) synthesis enzyme MnmG [Butyrivibrio sp. INlla16]SDB65600.1 tRNA uridine 5-carboxymethylaminomethyl modification enzyme [Butyrivibrio sp. INlla16]
MIVDNYDVIVIGGGHAGCEAGLAAARLGLKTIIFTLSVDNIAFMPCNPHIGGSSKGHLVREIDALGGEMGKNIDKTYLQSKMLNKSKGPAIHSLRAQADKLEYSKSMRMILQAQKNLTVKQAEIEELLYDDISTDKDLIEEGYEKKISGVKTVTGLIYKSKAVVLCTGTYLKSRCLCGESISYTGPNGLQPSNLLSQSLIDGGVELRRFKTGTPARMDGNTIDYSKMEIQTGDTPVVPFSFDTNPDDIQKGQHYCYLTYTNEKTHEIIRNNIDRSPIYAGIIEGIGPRYCPSIEDKVVKFPDKIRHQVFIEPEGTHTNEMYVDGMSSSMPEDVQIQMYRSVPGLENCVIVKNAYAIEYDCLCSGQLYPTLEIKKIRGLFSAGQFNGSSGYEEAAAQGLFAGINACMQILGKPYLSIDRSEGYIGVLVDDIVTKDNLEPYRMMTSRAEYRLLLRQDNADIRLRKKGYEVGLISEEKYKALLLKEELIKNETERLKELKVGASKDVQDFMDRLDSPRLKTAASIAELICRPELNYYNIAELDPERPKLSKDVIEQVEINIKYEGYIERQQRQVDKFKKMENKKIPADIDYNDVISLRLEARANLKKFKPVNVGQASRISGVNPADISVLLVYLENYRKNSNH